MLAEIFKKSFDKYFDAPVEAWIEFAALCEPVTYKKDEIIKKEDTIADFNKNLDLCKYKPFITRRIHYKCDIIGHDKNLFI